MIWCHRFEPRLSLGFSRHAASRPLSNKFLSMYYCRTRTQANLSPFISSVPGWRFRIDLTPPWSKPLRAISRLGRSRGPLGHAIDRCIMQTCSRDWVAINNIMATTKQQWYLQSSNTTFLYNEQVDTVASRKDDRLLLLLGHWPFFKK